MTDRLKSTKAGSDWNLSEDGVAGGAEGGSVSFWVGLGNLW